MLTLRHAPPLLALGSLITLLGMTPRSGGFSLLGFSLGIEQRDFRVFNNFTDAAANNNTTEHPNFPGAVGAPLAIWKGTIEWNSTSHGDGTGDPTQPNLGDGGANFDAHYQGEASGVGGPTDNIHSELAGSSGGIVAFTESSGGAGWRIRYYSAWTWSDGPGAPAGSELDLQGTACRLYGNALGLGSTAVPGSTMSPLTTSLQARSIEADDMAGIQAIYGPAAAGKPLLGGLTSSPTHVVLQGTGFDMTGNEVWFTEQGGSGSGARVLGIPSPGGTSLSVAIPATASPGNVLARNSGSGGASFSNTWPFPGPGLCTGTPNTTFEPNNDCTQASFMVGGTYSDLYVEQTDRDFYSITVGAGKTLRVVTGFEHAAGDVDLRLWELIQTCPGNLLATASSSSSSRNWEELEVTNTSGNSIDYVVEVLVSSTSPTTCNNYDLTLGCCLGGPVGDRYCTSVVNSTGFAARLFVSGSPVVADNDLCLSAGPVPPTTFGVFIAAPNQTQVPFGDGFLCLTGSIQRLTVAGGGGSTVVCHDLDVPGSGFSPGDTRNFQFWYRDPPGGPSGFNLTDAVSILFQ